MAIGSPGGLEAIPAIAAQDFTLQMSHFFSRQFSLAGSESLAIFSEYLMNWTKMPSYVERGAACVSSGRPPRAGHGSRSHFYPRGYRLLFITIGIMLIKRPNVTVDPKGKFCYGRGILKMMVTSHPGIQPRQPTGAASPIDLSASLRR
jgi:hypothetical protein